MPHFCPICGNLLMLESSSWTKLVCQTCPYVHVLRQGEVLTSTVPLKKKEVDDILGGDDAWKNVDRTQARCQNDECQGTEAYFFMAQLRSADEPMTTFYKCCSCNKRWSE
eukprot:51672_1